MRWRGQLLSGLGDAVCRRPWLPVVFGLALAVAGGLSAWFGLEFHTSRNDLIGRDSEYWRLYSAYAREFGGEDNYLVVVEGDRPERNRAAVDTVAQALVRDGFDAADVFHRANYTPLQPWFLYYLPTNDLVALRDSLGEFRQLVTALQHDPRLTTFVEAMGQMLQQMETASPADRQRMAAFLPTVTAVVSQIGLPGPYVSPWAGVFLGEERASEAARAMRWDGYHVFRDGRTYLLLVHPGAPETIPRLRRALDRVRPQFPDVRLSLTGEAVLDNDEMVASERDTVKSSVLTLVLVGIVIVAGFRDWLRMLLSIACLVQVIIITLGYATLAVGHLNIITITFTVMILGLGEDLGVQFISRFEEELGKGADRFGAVRAALRSTGPSIITAGVTNAAAFFAMGLSGFRGVIELGVIAGGGMLLATVGMTVLLPGWLLCVRRRTEPVHMPAKAHVTAIERALLARPHLTLAVCAAVTVAAGALTCHVRFDSNVLNLQSAGLESVATELRLLQADRESTIYAAVVAGDLDEARRLHEALSRLPSVSAVHSLAELMPIDQPAKAPLVRAVREQVGAVKFAAPTEDIAALRNALGVLRARAAGTPLAAAAQAARERLATTSADGYGCRFFADLEAQLALLAGQADRPMQLADVPPELRRVLVGRTGRLLLRVYPKENIWEREPLERFVAEVRRVAPQATGTPVGLYEFIGILQRGYIKAALWALAVIAVMVFVDLRGWLATVLTLVPLLFGIVWMTGAMALLGLPFNPANILALPLMVGIGVAYGVYFVQRYREDGEATFYGKSTGRAVMLSALTALIAFASLMIGNHRGIVSLGVVMSLGVLLCLLASLTLLPALLEVARRKGWRV
jgi:hopanoid biosynthesis associated RND transporter like protein HpnN